MAAIQSKNTKPELLIRHWLFTRGYRYRLNVNYVPGHPDLFLRKYNTAIFIHGCFWHRHNGCKYAYMPKSRVDFWNKKFCANIQRDKAVSQELAAKGYKQLIIWECSINKMAKNSSFMEDKIAMIIGFLESDQLYLEL